MNRTNAAETIIHAVWDGDAAAGIPVAVGSALLRSASAYAARCSKVGKVVLASAKEACNGSADPISRRSVTMSGGRCRVMMKGSCGF